VRNRLVRAFRSCERGYRLVGRRCIRQAPR
jgi:hypothetical protein